MQLHKLLTMSQFTSLHNYFSGISARVAHALTFPETEVAQVAFLQLYDHLYDQNFQLPEDFLKRNN